MTHIYTGEGKGKTSAALGLALRFAGYGGNVIIVQFGKGRVSGELMSLARIPNIKVLRNGCDFGFWSSMSEKDKVKLRDENNINLNTALLFAKDSSCDLLILDEIISAYEIGSVDRELVDALLDRKPSEMELVLTGRNAPKNFIDRADYVSEIKNIRHPYDRGIAARKGIEY